jgi:hypothetical protein
MRFEMDDSRIKDVSALLSSFFDAEKLRQGEKYSDFFSSWAGFVGSRLAAHSRVADVNKGILIVEAEHPGWIQLLQFRQSSILEAVSKRYPEFNLKGIAFRLIEKKGQTAATPKTEVGEELPEAAVESGLGSRAGEEGTVPDVDPEVSALFSDLKKAMQAKNPRNAG